MIYLSARISYALRTGNATRSYFFQAEDLKRTWVFSFSALFAFVLHFCLLHYPSHFSDASQNFYPALARVHNK